MGCQSREKDFPAYIKHIGNQCNILRSKNGNAVAIDCGGTDVTDNLLAMIECGEIKSIDAMYITHYHDDHVDGCGYFRCIDVLKKYMPDYIINQHVWKAFDFAVEQLEHMKKNLVERMLILSNLSVWDNINYSLDEYFIMAYPYEQDESDIVKLLISDYTRNIKCEIAAPKQIKKKSIYGIRIYAGDMYLGQKSCFIVNKKEMGEK